MDKPNYHAPIARNKSNAQQSKGIPAGLMIDEYDSLISPFKMKDEGNYTMFNNDILEALPLRKIRPEASKTYQWLYRKIIGYQKVVDRISLSQIEEGTDLTTRSVTRALKELLQRNMIIKIKIRSNCYYGLTSIEKWTSREKLKLIGKKPIQGDMFANNDKENAIDRIVYNMDTSAEGDKTELSINVDRTVHIVDTSAGDKRKKETYTKKSLNARAREEQRPCKMTRKGLTNEEVIQHVAINYCDDNYTSCPDDCSVWPKYNLIKLDARLIGKKIEDIDTAIINIRTTHAHAIQEGEGNAQMPEMSDLRR